MNKEVEAIFDKGLPYRCPNCGNILKCFFHERDSTSGFMYCPVCSWQQNAGLDGNWGPVDDDDDE